MIFGRENNKQQTKLFALSLAPHIRLSEQTQGANRTNGAGDALTGKYTHTYTQTHTEAPKVSGASKGNVLLEAANSQSPDDKDTFKMRARVRQSAPKQHNSEKKMEQSNRRRRRSRRRRSRKPLASDFYAILSHEDPLTTLDSAALSSSLKRTLTTRALFCSTNHATWLARYQTSHLLIKLISILDESCFWFGVNSALCL